MGNISIRLNLLQLNAAVKKLKGQSGEIECLVLPIKQNSLYEGEKGIYLDLQAFEIKNKKGDSKDTHLIKQSLPKEVYDKLTEEERKEQPIIGNATMWGGGPATEKVKSSSAPLGSEDDLPF